MNYNNSLFILLTQQHEPNWNLDVTIQGGTAVVRIRHTNEFTIINENNKKIWKIELPLIDLPDGTEFINWKPWLFSDSDIFDYGENKTQEDICRFNCKYFFTK